MDYPRSLKHLSRSPLPFQRIPDHLCAQIILKQSVGVIFNLPHTNSRCSSLVEIALSHDPNVAIMRETFDKFGKNELIPFSDWAAYGVFEGKLFPPSEYQTPADDAGLCRWLSHMNYLAMLFITWKKLDRSELQERRRYNPFLTDLWEEQQRRGPRQISLRSVPDQLLRKILSKATSMSAIQLAKTTSSMTAAFDGYVESILSIQVMIETGHLLASDTEYSIDRDSTIRYPFAKSGTAVRRIYYLEDSLLVSSFRTYLWPSTADRSVIEENQKKHEESMSRKYLKNKNKEMREILGQTYIPKQLYEIDEKFH